MEFLKSLVPAVISGDGGATGTATTAGSVTLGTGTELLPRDSGPRLLRVKRLGLLAMGQTIEEDLEVQSQPVRPPRLYRHRPKGTDHQTRWT